jgi:dihydroxyacetone kinase
MSAMTDAIAAIAAAMIEAKDELNQLDGVAGDGDLGVTMAAAGAVLARLLPELEGQAAAAVLKRCGLELARAVPSTGGTLVATALLRASRAAEPVDGPAPRLARAVAAAQAGIEQVGKVGPGDKTMVDALAPAAEALAAAAGEGDDLATALDRAAAAAADGAAATRGMRARVGRAGWLPERSAGHEDAGARLVALVFVAAARWARSTAHPAPA